MFDTLKNENYFRELRNSKGGVFDIGCFLQMHAFQVYRKKQVLSNSMYYHCPRSADKSFRDALIERRIKERQKRNIPAHIRRASMMMVRKVRKKTLSADELTDNTKAAIKSTQHVSFRSVRDIQRRGINFRHISNIFLNDTVGQSTESCEEQFNHHIVITE